MRVDESSTAHCVSVFRLSRGSRARKLLTITGQNGERNADVNTSTAINSFICASVSLATSVPRRVGELDLTHPRQAGKLPLLVRFDNDSQDGIEFYFSLDEVLVMCKPFITCHLHKLYPSPCPRQQSMVRLYTQTSEKRIFELRVLL